MTDSPTAPLDDSRARAAELFAELCELTPKEQSERLAELEAVNGTLARRLVQMLALDAADSGPLERARDELAAAGRKFLGTEAPAPPDRLGPWQLGERLGAGGMGEVYGAERHDGGFHQEAAIKIVRSGMATEAVVARFELERRVLAHLEHPSIARLLDGGVAPDGRPWFAMERVVGTPITDFAREHDLDLEARIRLLIEVARAVDVAHRSLVVHRDLKPSNILITADGTPKLLDFGLAKLLDPEADLQLTRPETRALTPAYAAPEQVLGEPVTTATDVYALGVLLYELLTGELPHRRSASTSGRLAEEVSRETVERPSQRLRRLQGATSRSTAKVRRLPEDLDTIVLRAMAREPERRYGSAAAFADDLALLLSGHPVSARPDSRRYRLARFLGRHRLAATASALVAVSLVGGLLAALFQAERATREAKRAVAAQRFLVGLFEAADPDRSLGADVTARQLLDAGVAELERGSASEPDLQASLFDTVAQIERRIGRYDSAERLARGAVERRERLSGARSVEAAAARVTLAEVLHSQSQIDEAAREFEKALADLKAQLPEDDPLLARTRASFAETEHQRGRTAEALTLAEEVLARARRVFGEEHPETASARQAIGALRSLAGDFAAARLDFEAALAVLERTLGPLHPKSAEAKLSLAELTGYLGERERAHRLFDEATAAFRRSLGDRHVMVAHALLKHALLYLNSGQRADADRVLLEALAIFTELGHYEAATCERMLGHSLLAAGRPAEAAARFERAHEQFLKRLGDDHVYTLAALGNLGTARVQMGELAAARSALEAAIAGLERVRGHESDDLRQPLLSLGEVERRSGDRERALRLHRRALAIAEAGVGAEHPGAANAHREIGLDLATAGTRQELANGLAELDRAIAIRKKSDPASARLADWLLEAASLAERTGDRAGAAARRREALTIREAAQKPAV